MTSPSIPTTSVICVTRRWPSRMRLTWQIRWTAEAICVRIAFEGRLIPVIPIMFSSRVSASRGLLAWIVLIEPSWPVFIACSMSSASSPRHSPMMMRSGRMRSAFFNRSRIVISPVPSRLAVRVSRRTTCGCCSCNSAASSIVTTRSARSIIRDSAFSSVVLPEPVPPEIRMLSRAARGDLQHRRHRRRDAAVRRHRVERDRSSSRTCGSRSTRRRSPAAG